jgi:uncharacterized protein (UPF0216 family)
MGFAGQKQQLIWFNNFTFNDSFIDTCNKVLRLPALEITLNSTPMFLGCDSEQIISQLTWLVLTENNAEYGDEATELRFTKNSIKVIKKVSKEIYKINLPLIIKINNLPSNESLLDIKLKVDFDTDLLGKEEFNKTIPLKLYSFELESKKPSDKLKSYFTKTLIDLYGNDSLSPQSKIESSYSIKDAKNPNQNLTIFFGIKPHLNSKNYNYVEGVFLNIDSTLLLNSWFIPLK